MVEVKSDALGTGLDYVLPVGNFIVLFLLLTLRNGQNCYYHSQRQHIMQKLHVSSSCRCLASTLVALARRIAHVPQGFFKSMTSRRTPTAYTHATSAGADGDEMGDGLMGRVAAENQGGE